MKQVEITVEKCIGCPFSSFEQIDELVSHANCLAPPKIHHKYNIDIHYKRNTSPSWCPLKKQDLLITFKN